MTTACLRYHYRTNDGPVQAALPMWTVTDDGETYVGWTPAGTSIMYWALEDGSDPRSLPLERRFLQPHVTAPRTWQGGGVLRVIPRSAAYQVVHFWDDGGFAGWYVNLETPKTGTGAFLESVDLHLDLQIDPARGWSWKDEDEADAAVAAGTLGTAELAMARAAGESVIAGIAEWPAPIGDWRGFVPPAAWTALPLPADWAHIS